MGLCMVGTHWFEERAVTAISPVNGAEKASAEACREMREATTGVREAIASRKVSPWSSTQPSLTRRDGTTNTCAAARWVLTSELSIHPGRVTSSSIASVRASDVASPEKPPDDCQPLAKDQRRKFESIEPVAADSTKDISMVAHGLQSPRPEILKALYVDAVHDFDRCRALLCVGDEHIDGPSENSYLCGGAKHL